MIPLDRDSDVPLAEQIEARLRELIAAGRLAPGAKLTSIRQFATQLAVSPNTVVLAYDRLVADGLAHSRGTTGYFVSEAEDTPPDDSPLEAGDGHDAVWFVQQVNDQRPGLLQASGGALPMAWLEDAVPVSLVQRALTRTPGSMAARCPPQGLPDLRERIAMLMRSQGLVVDANRVLTTCGGTHAIDLICRAFLKPGDAVVVEDPGYFLMFARLRQSGVTLVPVARQPDGIDVAQFEQLCAEHRPKLAFLQTVLHNPTGWSSSAANLHRVLRVAERHGVLLAEDDVHGHFQPGEPTRLAQLAALERVIYFSSFCKALSPALRMGYIAADPALLRPLMREKITSVLSTPSLNERILLEVLSTGRFRKHADRLQDRLRAARVSTSRQLRAAGIVFDTVGEHGVFLWGRVPDAVDVATLTRDAYDQGIVLASGSTFRPDASVPDAHIRFNVATSQHVRLAEYLTPRLNAAEAGSEVLKRIAAASGG